MHKIVVKDLHKSFGSFNVLNGVDLHIPKGISYVILGKSGCGKSVLFKLILGLMEPDAGDVFVNDISVRDKRMRSAYISKFSMLFQSGALFDSMSVIDNVAFPLVQSGINWSSAKGEAAEKIKAVGLDSRVFNLYPADLSGGMKKRVALARAIVAKPEIILFDEPTTGLDPATGVMISHLIRNMIQDIGVTAITITHDLSVVNVLANRIAVIDDGKIVWDGAKDNFDKTDNKLIHAFKKAAEGIAVF